MIWLLACGGPVPPECEIDEGLPSFPGAEGFGATTPGGRGGATLFVTSLADDGPGTLREAVRTPGPRTILFRTGGTITLASQLEIVEPFLTIAGQSAPGDGVQLRGAGIVVLTHDVVVRHLRVRPGPAGGGHASEVNDAIAVLGAEYLEDAGHDVVLDHLSVAWSEDEAVSVWGEARDVTVSWSIIAEPLDRSGHPKGGHAAGFLAGDQSSCVSLHHTLMAHNGFRNPLLAGGGLHDVTADLFYDYGELAAEVAPITRPTRASFRGVAWKAGPSTTWEGPAIWLEAQADPVHWVSEPWHLLGSYGTLEVFVEDALAPGEIVGTNRDGEGTTVAEPFEVAPVTRVEAADLEDVLLPEVGAFPRDAADARVIGEVRAGTGGIVDDPAAVGGWPELDPGTPWTDGDADGLPDDWEAERGLDPADPGDAASDPDGDGYSRLEDWLAERAAAR